MSREEEIRAGLFEHTLNGHAPEVKALTEEALGLGMSPMDILFKALIPSLEEVGRRFEKGDFFVPEMLIAARAMQGALVILRPLIAETGAQPVGRYVIGTVKGDIHDIGKNLCVIMLEGAGFEVFDLGVNTPPEKFVAAVEEHKPDVIGFSAFLTTTMPMFKANIEALTKAGLREKVHVAVGGAPVTLEYAKHVGADSYAPDASMATRMAKQLVGDRRAGPGGGGDQGGDGGQRRADLHRLVDHRGARGRALRLRRQGAGELGHGGGGPHGADPAARQKARCRGHRDGERRERDLDG